ncbi:MAG: RagB/SusD family nutrient uptake outer membrane protein [Bacteroidales bacterium]|nr:RagB/SusD family nutrient uptake outer membrane protein [Bacteroidales bacterium]
MKRIYAILPAAALIIYFTACENLLDPKPHQYINDEISLDSDQNVKKVLVGAYSQFDDPSIYGGCILRNSELLGADDECLWTGVYPGPRQIFKKQMDAANEDVTNQWLESYEVVNIANNVLSALDVVNEADRDRVEGEALFLRSLMFFDLVRFYARQYSFGEVNSQFGIPLVLTPSGGIGEAGYKGRNTVEDVYGQIITDLTSAAVRLPLENGIYADRGAANALLARVYLQKGDYAKARDAANAVITSGKYELLPLYKDVFNNDENSPEDIFATQITPQDYRSSMTEFFSIPDYGGRDGDIEILEGHLSLYSPGDQRRALFFNGNGGMRSGKWNNLYGVVNLIRLAEMYLIRAECNFRLGTCVGDTPLDDYNAVHVRAGLQPALTITLDDIILERRLELSFEGFRIHDQRRLHQDVGILPYDAPSLIFPIPAREIAANPDIAGQQNEGY